jgi:ribosomal protein S18 acetylase RimI-like enzyme
LTLDEPSHRAICHLLPQLTTASVLPTLDELAAILGAPCTEMLVARDEGEIVGMLTLVVVALPTGRAAHIEDVVVDERSRGRGVGRQLIEAALIAAKDAGAKHVDLTSRSTRVAANALYQSLGFVQRDTNLYRYVPPV